MKLVTARYEPTRGWSRPLPAELDSRQTLVVVFGAPELAAETALWSSLERAFPRSHKTGCSTAGEIFGTSISDATASVAVLQLERAELAATAAAVESPADSRRAGSAVARALDKPGLRGVVVLSDGLHVNGSELVAGINTVLAESVVVTGGLAADGDRFQSTWVLRDGRPAEGFVSAIGFYGDDVRLGHGSRGGWDIFGPERIVTRSSGNVLYELDGRPALQLYKEYLGERAAGLPATALLFPLAVRAGRGDTNSRVRTILGIDETAQSMTFAGDIPQGSLAQLMKANFDRLVQGASEAALMTAAPREGAGPVLALAVSCVGRRLVLGERTEEEIEATREVLPPAAEQIGFYSYGEISPYASGRCELHNQTMTLTTIEER